MAYGLKYRAIAYGLSQEAWRVDFEEKDFTPANDYVPIQLSLPSMGLRIGWDREDDRFNLIYSRYVEITLKVTPTFSINNFQFDDERKYKIKVYKGNNLEFIGWLIPSFPSQEFEDDSIAVFQLMAKDTINQLKKIPFVNEKPEQVSTLQNFTDLISQALRATGLELNFEVYYNKYFSEMNKTANDCPLQQTEIDIYSFKKQDGTYIDYYEVLFRILSTHDLKLCQARGRWEIFSPVELVDGSVTGRVFNYLGVKQTNVALNTDLQIHGDGLKVLKNTQIRKSPPIQQVSAVFELSDNVNLVKNGELDSFANGVPLNWSLSTVSDDGEPTVWLPSQISQNAGGGLSINGVFQTLPTYSGPQDLLIDRDIPPIKFIKSDLIDVSGLDIFKFSAEIYADSDIDIVRFRITVYGLTNETKYIDSYGKISDLTETSVYVNKGEFETSRVINVDFSFAGDNSFTASGIDIRLYPGIRVREGLASSTTVKFKNIILTGRSAIDAENYVGRKWEYNNTNLPHSTKLEPIKVYFEDSFNMQTINRKNVNKLYFNGANTTEGHWKRTAETGTNGLVQSILIDRLLLSGLYSNIIEGSVFGYVSIIDTPIITSEDSRYLVLFSEYSLHTNETELLLIELTNSTINISSKVFDVYENGRTVEVETSELSSATLNINESFDLPIRPSGGIMYGGLIVDKWIDSLPINSTDPRATNKGTLLLGPVNAQNIELGNRANDTLVEILGRFGIRTPNNFLAQFSVADLTANRVATLPDRNIEINKWSDLSGVPSSLVNALSGTTNYLPKFTSSTELGNSQVFDNGTNVGIGTTNPLAKFQVNGTSRLLGQVTSQHIVPLLTNVYNIGSSSQAYNTLFTKIISSGTSSELYLIANNNSAITIVDSNVSIGSEVAPTEKLDVYGNINVRGRLKVADSFGVNKSFLKSNGSTQSWEVLTVSDISDMPTSFTPTAHTHTIGDVANLSAALDGKQGLNAILTALTGLTGNGIVRKTGTTAFSIGTNDPITLSGDVSGTGTTAITTVLSNTGVAAGTYRSVTVDAKGRVTAGSVPNYNVEWDSRWNTKLLDYVEFGSDVFVAGGSLGVANNFFLGALFFDKDSSTGTANQVLMPVTGGVAWTSLSTAQISNFSANVLGQVLTGYAVGANTALAAGDTILSAFGKLETKVDSKANAFLGTAGYLPKFTSTNSIGASVIYEDSGKIGIGSTSTDEKVHIYGGTLFIQNENARIRYYNNGAVAEWLTGQKNISSHDFSISKLIAGNETEYLYINAFNGNLYTQNRIFLSVTAGIENSGTNLKLNADGGVVFMDNANPQFIQFASGVAVNLLNGNGNSFFNGGNVGIGIDAPIYKLDVGGSGRFADVVQFDAIPSCALIATSANHLVNLATVQSLVSAGFSVSTPCVLVFNTNQSLSGAKTQGGYTTVTGDNILLAGQSSASENGVYVFDGTNWTRNVQNDTDVEIRGKGHLVLNGTYASTQWVNNNASTITVGTTAITYVQWSGAELDPVWDAYKTTNNLTPTRFAQWDAAYTAAVNLPTNYQQKLVGFGYLKISSAGVISYDPYLANQFAENQFNQTNTFLGKTVVRTPLTPTEAANADYVDTRINAINTGFWQKINTNGIGTTTNTSLDFYTNNTKAAQLSGRTLLGLRNIHINDGVYLAPYSASGFSNYYGLTSNNSAMIGYLGGTSNGLYSLDLVRGATTGNRSGVRFGRFSSGGGLNNFAYGIEYSTTEKLQIGFYASNQMNGASTSLAASTSLTVISNGFVGFGMDLPTYRVDVSGDVNITGMYRINGSFGADHTFLKSNGTTQEWALMTVGEIADISTTYLSLESAENYALKADYLSIANATANYALKADAVLYGTFEGERGFKLFHDAGKTDTAALFFANEDTGTVGIHYYGLDSNDAVTQHGIHIAGDGFVYHKKLNGQKVRFLTTDDSITTGGGSGVTYTLAEPLFFAGNQINVRTASSTQIGVLSSADWNTFNNKQNLLAKASSTQDGYLSKEDWLFFSQSNTWTGGQITSAARFGNNVPILWINPSEQNLSNYLSKMEYGLNPASKVFSPSTGDIGLLVESAANFHLGAIGNLKIKGQKVFINNIELDMAKVAALIGV